MYVLTSGKWLIMEKTSLSGRERLIAVPSIPSSIFRLLCLHIFTLTNSRDSFNSISDNFAAQFGIILYKVYKISYDTYKDIPRGEIKVFFYKENTCMYWPWCKPFQDTLMRKLSCKTLMSILPEDLITNIQNLMAERKVSQDFDTVVATIAEIKLGA